LASLRLELGIPEGQRRKLLNELFSVGIAGYVDLCEQGDTVGRAAVIVEMVAAHGERLVEVGFDRYSLAAVGGADLKTGTIVGERIGADFVLVFESDRDQKAILTNVIKLRILDAFEPGLLPGMGSA